MCKHKSPEFQAPDLSDYLPLTSWDDKLAAAKIKQLFEHTLTQADTTINWYRTYKVKKGRVAKTIRIAATLLLICSTLMPYMASLNAENKTNASLLYFGYLLAGLGGGLLLLDRYYGYSNSWIRFVLTGQDLQRIRDTFIEHWQVVYVQQLPLTIDSFGTLIGEISTFRELFGGTVKAETETWAREFQQSMKELIDALNEQRDQMKDAYVQFNDDKASASGSGGGEIPEEIFQQAINDKYNEWKKLYGIVAVSYGRKIKGGETMAVNSLIFFPPEKLDPAKVNFLPVPAVLPYKALNDVLYALPTDVVGAGGRFRASNNPALLCDNMLPKRPGVSISRIIDDSKDSTGTLGLIVYRDKQPYLLSCYHVLCAQELDRGDQVFKPANAAGKRDVISPSREDETGNNKGLVLGSVVDGELNHMLDGAIAELNPTVDYRDSICSINRVPSGILSVRKSHADNHHPLRAVGRTSGIMKGTIVTHDTECDVDYDINGQIQTITLKHVILTDQHGRSGDSGAGVIDYDNKIIGILVAANGPLSCIVPIGRLLTRFNISLNPTT